MLQETLLQIPMTETEQVIVEDQPGQGVLVDIVAYHQDGSVMKSETIYRIVKSIEVPVDPEQVAQVYNAVVEEGQEINPTYARAYLNYLQKRGRISSDGDLFSVALPR